MSLRDIYDTGFDEDTDTTTDNACPECGGTLVTADGETCCPDCGLVTNEYRLAHGAEPRTFDESDESKKRTGSPLTFARHDRGLTSTIGRKHDAHGNTLSQDKRRRLRRLRTQHNRAQRQSKAERNLAFACSEIARLVSALDLTRDHREEASLLFRRAQDQSLVRGRSIESIAAGSVYGACRCRGEILTVERVASVSSRTVEQIENAYSVLNRELGLAAKVRRPRSFIPRCASACDASIPSSIQHRATELAAMATDHGLANGTNPAGVAAACLYLAGREHDRGLTQTELAAAASVSPTTLRERYYELQECLEGSSCSH